MIYRWEIGPGSAPRMGLTASGMWKYSFLRVVQIPKGSHSNGIRPDIHHLDVVFFPGCGVTCNWEKNHIVSVMECDVYRIS